MALVQITRALAVLAVVVFIAAWVSSAVLASRATLAQRIEPHEPAMAQLLNEPGTPIGDPQRYIVFDEKVFLEGSGPNGVRLLNERYMIESGHYPWQLKTVEFLRNAVLLASGLGFALMAGLSIWLARRGSRVSLRQQTRG
jgi:hypothetical protein